MMRTSMLAAAVGLLFLAAEAPTLSAQETPDFSGTWTLMASPDAAPPAAGQRAGRAGRGGFGGLGESATIVQDAATLTLTSTSPMGEMKTVYNLDGSPSTSTRSFGERSIEQTSTAKWDGARLVIVTATDMGGQGRETTMTLSMNDQGQLVVESTRPGRGGGAATTTQTYAKGG